jgi:hypothetical protein
VKVIAKVIDTTDLTIDEMVEQSELIPAPDLPLCWDCEGKMVPAITSYETRVVGWQMGGMGWQCLCGRWVPAQEEKASFGLRSWVMAVALLYGCPPFEKVFAGRDGDGPEKVKSVLRVCKDMDTMVEIQKKLEEDDAR